MVHGLFVKQLQKTIHHETAQHAQNHLAGQDPHDHRDRNGLGEHDRQHLIRGGQKCRDQAAGADHAARIQAGCRCGKTALRHHSHECRQGRSGRSGLDDQVFRMTLCLLFDRFHNQIGHEKKGNQLGRIFDHIE